MNKSEMEKKIQEKISFHKREISRFERQRKYHINKIIELQKKLFIKQEYPCRWCSMIFNNVVGLHNHERSHPEKEPLIKAIRENLIKSQKDEEK